MTQSKKYYWLKLKDGFFNMKEIKKLRKIAGGDTYTIIYLKMQLLSIKNGGIIKYEGTEVNILEQLALELDESEENIKMTLAYLKANNLIENLGNDEFLLNKVPELIGSETDAAERMRRLRGKNKSEHKCNNVTEGRNDVTQSKIEYSNSYSDTDTDTPDQSPKNEKEDMNIPTWCISLAEQIYLNASKTPKKHELEAGAKVLHDIERLDGYKPDEIQKAIEWGLRDKRNGFNWSSQLKSPARLRNKRNGAGDLTKFENLRADYLTKNPPEAVPSYLRSSNEKRMSKPMWEE